MTKSIHTIMPFRSLAAVGLAGGTLLLGLLSCGGDSGTEPQGPVATSIEITAPETALEEGASTQLSAAVEDTHGTPIPDASLTWSARDPSVVSVDGEGLATAVGLGVGTVVAEVNGIADSVDLAVAGRVHTAGESAVDTAGEDGVLSVATEDSTLYQFTLTDTDGARLRGATMRLTQIEGKRAIVLEGGGDEYPPLLFFADPDTLAAYLAGEFAPSASLRLTPAPPSSAVVEWAVLGGAIAIAKTADLTLDYFANAIEIQRIYWQITEDGGCVTYGDLDQMVDLRIEQRVGTARLLLAFMFGAIPAHGPIDLAGSFLIEAAVEESLDILEFLVKTHAHLGYGEADWNTRARIRFEEIDPESFDAKWQKQFVGYQLNPEDAYCSGKIPHQLSALSPTEFPAGLGTTQKIQLRVLSEWGNGVEGVGVTFSVQDGHGTLTSDGAMETTVQTDATGTAAVDWTLPSEEGTYSLSVSASHEGEALQGAPVTFTARVADEPSRYHIEILGGGGYYTNTELRLTFGVAPSHLEGLGSSDALDGVRVGIASTPRPDTVSGSVHYADFRGETATDLTEFAAESIYLWLDSKWGSDIDTSMELWATLPAGSTVSCAALDSNTDDLAYVRVDGVDISCPEGRDSGALWSQVSAGETHSCGVNTSGKAYCWGENEYGRLGDGSTSDSRIPVVVSGGLVIVQVSAGRNQTCGITSTGDAYCWGRIIRDMALQSSSVPVLVPGDVAWTGISVGYEYACGLSQSGHAYCWGSGSAGNLGNGSTSSSDEPVLVVGDHDWAEVAAGDFHACGVTSSGEAYCWGENHYGQLGDGRTTDSSVPVPVSGDHTWERVDPGDLHSCGVTTGGEVYCWGAGYYGRLGNGSDVDSSIPVLVSGGHTWGGVTAGSAHSCGTTTAREVFCWGHSGPGALGDGLTANSPVPVLVAGGHTWAQSSAGEVYSCGLSMEGQAYCWGRNSYGQLGDGSRTDSSVPVRVSDP